MPTYEYKCKRSHVTEALRAVEDRSKRHSCSVCGEEAELIVSTPNFKLSWIPTVIDTAKEAWSGTPLADSDGKNEVHYKAKSIQMDLGA